MKTPAPLCLICAAPALEEIPGFAKLARVTSDCKPWPAGGQLFICTACGGVQKLPTPTWRDEANRIYEDYVLYAQSDGVEQAVFDGKGRATASRSENIVTRLSDVTSLPAHGRLLDIGCGNGAFLRAFAEHYPGWELHGKELDERNLDALSKIPGFQNLHTGDLAEIDETFECVSIIHALEHIERPKQFLEQMRSVLSTPDTIIIQVPDWRANPFDLLIADHVLHFSILTLGILLHRAGLMPVSLVDDWIAKEISLVACPSSPDALAEHPVDTNLRRTHAAVESSLDWLAQLSVEAKAFCSGAGPNIGIFGTSIAAGWLYGIIEERVTFFVDEDPNRAGGSVFGLPILMPDDVPEDAHVFVPLATETARKIAHRLDRKDGPRYTAPKTIPDET